eukprot:7502324-Alexandrium_andersonii.AAC.1
MTTGATTTPMPQGQSGACPLPSIREPRTTGATRPRLRPRRSGSPPSLMAQPRWRRSSCPRTRRAR